MFPSLAAHSLGQNRSQLCLGSRTRRSPTITLDTWQCATDTDTEHGHRTQTRTRTWDMGMGMAMANEATIFNNELAIEIAVVALRSESSSSHSRSCLCFQDYERCNYYLLIGRHVSAAFVILARVQLLTHTSRQCIVANE